MGIGSLLSLLMEKDGRFVSKSILKQLEALHDNHSVIVKGIKYLLEELWL